MKYSEKSEKALQLEQQIETEIDFETLNEVCEHLKDAIQEIFNSCGLYFRIFSRVKSAESIAGKIHRRQYGTEKNPKKLQDLIGLRIVLYYYDDLSICRDIMESTFQMVDHWSRTNNNTNEFKATKINGVFRFPAEYFSLYKKELWSLPIDTTFEIQFRTVFFEGWHEIEHDMRYKSLLSDDQFWQGSEELSRILNCILANLELSDWSLVQLFEQLSYNHYKNSNWELMLKSKFRIRMDDRESLHPDILKLFDRDKKIAKQFFKCSRKSLIRELLKFDNPHVSYNLIIKLLNDLKVHNEEITAIFNTLPAVRDDRSYQKTVFARLESAMLFHLELPLLHKESKSLETEFNTAATILYKWARYKLDPVFEDIPTEVCSYKNHLPGYRLKVNYEPENLTFTMKIYHIDSKLAGTLWHIHSSIALMDDGKLHFYHMTSRDMPRGIAQHSTFIKPSFLTDLSNKVGLVDIVRLGNKVYFVTNPEEFSNFEQLIANPDRKLPVIAILQQSKQAEKQTDPSYLDGYDMNTFTINGTRLSKVIGHYSHVYMLDQCLIPEFAKRYSFSESNADGCICIFWPEFQKKTPELFTREMVCDAQFDFNRFAFHDQNIYEKAFRHKLVQIIKDDNVSH